MIRVFADSFCASPPLSGSATDVELSGKAKIELNEFIKKITDLGLEGAAKYKESKWQGVLQKDLARLYEASTKCKQKVLSDLTDKLMPADEDKLMSFIVIPERAQPGNDVTLHLEDYLRESIKVFMSGRVLPIRISADRRKVVITVPGGTPSGEYILEIELDDERYRAENTLKVDDPLDNFSFDISPTNIMTGQKIELYLSDPIGKRFDVYIQGNYGRVNQKLVKSKIHANGRVVTVVIPDEIPDGSYSIVLRWGNRRFSGSEKIQVDNPRSRRAPPSN
jgi:hypothetical protein